MRPRFMPVAKSLPLSAHFRRLDKLTTAKAAPWKARFPVFTEIKQEGDFARAY